VTDRPSRGVSEGEIRELVMIRPAEGGVAHVAARCADELRRRGTAVTELVGTDDGCAATGAARTVWAHRSLIRRADVVHVELGLTALSSFWTAIWASLVRGDLVTVVHDGPSVVKSPGSGVIRAGVGWRDAVAHKLFAPLLDGVLRAGLRRRTRCWVVFSDRVRLDLERAGLRPVVVARHGADPPTASAPPSRCTSVVFAGFVARSKGVDVLLDAWEMVCAATDLRLQIVGGHGRHEASYVAAIRERIRRTHLPVTWRGHVTDDELRAAIAEAAIVVLPYRSSNPVSGILVRAAVEGRAIVASSVPAFVDVLESEVNALVVEADDPEGLSKALLELANDEEKRDALGRSIGHWAGSHCSWSLHVTALEGAYRRSPR
jgi:glycosyltransferase involved in cell wall biosynthesis